MYVNMNCLHDMFMNSYCMVKFPWVIQQTAYFCQSTLNDTTHSTLILCVGMVKQLYQLYHVM
jgi:hypothetical protein